MIPDFPEEINKARNAYWEVVKPYLDAMSMVEVRAFEYYINMDDCISGYLLRRASKMKKEE